MNSKILQSPRPGRNDFCPCGSGKKYKKCHLYWIDRETKQKIEESKALELQRKKQQGLGKPILSRIINNTRVITVGDRDYSGKYVTFHDFLFDYLKSLFPDEWWKSEELKKHPHPIVLIYNKLVEYKKNMATVPNSVNLLPATGAVMFYNSLAYNLYLIYHNVSSSNHMKLKKILRRLRSIESFSGACFEIHVAAIFIRAGYDIEFEEEKNRSDSCCEFNATDKLSGEKFSVEAKRRVRQSIISSNNCTRSLKLDVNGLLTDALEKNAAHNKIVFIDISLPMNESTKYVLNDFLEVIRLCEKNDLAYNNSLKPAYVFLTNLPYHYDEELISTNSDPLYFAEGFKIPDFGNVRSTLEEAVLFMEKHKCVHSLWESIKEHQMIPVTFDGSIPEYCFSDSQRYITGREYAISVNGKNEIVTLTYACVMEAKKCMWLFFLTKDGSEIRMEKNLSETELHAYRNNPDTFFGITQELSKGIHCPLDAYAFLKKAFHGVSREELIKKLENVHPLDFLINKTKDELLDIFCIKMAPILYNTRI